MEERKQVDASTAKYHPKYEPHKRDLDKHLPTSYDYQKKRDQEESMPGIYSPAT
ncbi:hypothetical protein Bca52824_058115 [Brassica carinata]|uniref:Uncharacterized protein n=1 Tax=Brassica carinata TaxID=52824 RepID=A0A8X7QVS9_BRACI|nr:hypothetical protein Bca52824_058115 [Brassica carinata]